MAFKLDSKIPAGELAQKWSNHKAAIKVVRPANKRKLDIIVVGTGLGGASAAASLGELGYNVKVFCIQDSPRRAHSIAAQGGINAAKNYRNDNDSIYRLFYDTLKGGDYRAREANVYRMAEVSNCIITSASARAFRSHASTAVCWTTVRSAVRRFRVRSMLAAKPVSSCCWALMPHSTRRSLPVR